MKPRIKFYSDGSIVRISTISLAYAVSSEYVQAYSEFESAASCNRWTKAFNAQLNLTDEAFKLVLTK